MILRFPSLFSYTIYYFEEDISDYYILDKGVMVFFVRSTKDKVFKSLQSRYLSFATPARGKAKITF